LRCTVRMLNCALLSATKSARESKELWLCGLFESVTYVLEFVTRTRITFTNTQRLSAAALAETLTEVLGTEVNSDWRGKSSFPDLTLLARKI
jgi:hypothetical protein